MRLFERLQQYLLSCRNCRPWLFFLLLLWFQNVCAILGQSSVAQAGVNPLCLAPFSAEQSPGSCNVPASVSLSLSPFCA